MSSTTVEIDEKNDVRKAGFEPTMDTVQQIYNLSL